MFIGSVTSVRAVQKRLGRDEEELRCTTMTQQFLPTLSQMHVMDFSESVLHVRNLLYPPETIYTLK